MPYIKLNDITLTNEDVISFCPVNQALIFGCSNHIKKTSKNLSNTNIAVKNGIKISPRILRAICFFVCFIVQMY